MYITNNTMMGTSIDIKKIIEIYNEVEKELVEEGIDRVNEYIKSKGYIVTTRLIEKTLRESGAIRTGQIQGI